MRLSESMSESRNHLSVYASREHLQASRDNSTESEEQPPPLPKKPPPPPPPTVNNGLAATVTAAAAATTAAAAAAGDGGGGGSGVCPQENQHQGKELLNTMVHLPIEVVFNLLFMQENFMNEIYMMKKTYDVVFGTWEEQEDGNRGRQTSYTMTLPSANLGPKVSYVTEKQVILTSSKPGVAYQVESEGTNGGIPYADAFTVDSHYCLTKEDETKTRIKVWVSIKYKKTLWGLIKTMIEKNTYSGVEGVLAEVVTQLATESDRLAAPKGARRRRRMLADKNHAGSKHSITPSHARGNAADGGEGIRSKSVLVVAAALVVLMVGNAVLYSRLSRLEQRSVQPDASLPASRYLSVTGSWKVVAKLLQRQEEIHQRQLDEWKAKLQQASTTLREVQETLEVIFNSIPEHEEELRRVLEQQSAGVLEGWLQTEDALKTHLTNLALEDAVVQRLQKVEDERKDST